MSFKSNIDVGDGHDTTTWSIDNLPNFDIMDIDVMSLKLVHEFAFDIDFECVIFNGTSLNIACKIEWFLMFWFGDCWLFND